MYFYQDVANGVSIDWGDGSAHKTNSNTGWVSSAHTYAEAGEYTISIAIDDGCSFDFGNDTSSYSVMGSTRDNGIVYCNMLQSVHIGEGVTSIGKYAFYNCYSLKHITIPYSVTSIADSAFGNCKSLSSITIPYSVTSIGDSAFSNCKSLSSVTIPDGVTSIADYAFNACYGMAEYHMKPTTPPTLSSTNAFNKIPSDCIIYVPKGSLNAYKSATNWSSYANYMREEVA